MNSLRGRHLLVTGATGFLGRTFCRAVLRSDPDATISVLGRGRGLDIDDRLRFLFGTEALGRMRGIEAAWERPDFGLSDAARLLLRDVEEVWHFAAATLLDPSRRQEVFTTNTSGTYYVLALAARSTALRCFNHVSTAYVCGRVAPGAPVQETLAWPSHGFRTSYEESKWLAELAVTRSGLPWRIFRPSIVVGDRRTGECDGKGIYAIARACARLERDARQSGAPLVRLRIPGDPAARKNIVPVDFAVPAMMRIRDRDAGLDTIYHVTADETCIQEEMLDGLRPHVRIPRLEFACPWPTTGLHPAERTIGTLLRGFTSYMDAPDPPFVTDNLDRDAGVSAPYLDRAAFEFLFGRFLALEGEIAPFWETRRVAAAGSRVTVDS